MAKITTTAYPTIETVDFDEIDLAIQRGRRLRSLAFTSFLREVFKGHFGQASDERAAELSVHRDCTSTA